MPKFNNHSIARAVLFLYPRGAVLRSLSTAGGAVYK